MILSQAYLYLKNSVQDAAGLTPISVKTPYCVLRAMQKYQRKNMTTMKTIHLKNPQNHILTALCIDNSRSPNLYGDMDK